jgi:hypothetical protein
LGDGVKAPCPDLFQPAIEIVLDGLWSSHACAPFRTDFGSLCHTDYGMQGA